jgi:hypothetical protein
MAKDKYYADGEKHMVSRARQECCPNSDGQYRTDSADNQEIYDVDQQT